MNGEELYALVTQVAFAFKKCGPRLKRLTLPTELHTVLHANFAERLTKAGTPMAPGTVITSWSFGTGQVDIIASEDGLLSFESMPYA